MTEQQTQKIPASLRAIGSISLKAGRPEEPSVVEIPISNTLLFIGPNNSGKSLALRELMNSLADPDESHQKRRLLKSAHAHWPSVAPLLQHMMDNRDDYNISRLPDDRWHLRSGAIQYEFRDKDIDDLLHSKLEGYFFKTFVHPYTTLSTGMTRFSVLKYEDRSGQGPLVDNKPDKLEAVSRDLYDAFGLHCAVKYTDPRHTGFCFSREDIPETITRREYSQEAMMLFANMMRLEDISDGVASYLSLIATLHVQRYRVLMIDEPEVFLFPALVRKLGAYATRLANEHGMNLVCSTHSPEFLIGCLQQSENISIVRLAYNYVYGEVFTVPPDDLRGFLRRPLVRSANALSALFAHGAVVTEGENDRAVYEIMFQKSGGEAFQRETIQLINARNKDSIAEMVGPLRAFGVPAAAVVDIDVLNKKHIWRELLRVAGVPESLLEGMAVQRHELWTKIEKAGVDVKTNGVASLPDASKGGVCELIDQVKGYGLFVVPVGELEGWLKELPRLRSKTEWATKAIEHLHSTQGVSGGSGWDTFVNDILAWIRDGRRKGMPIVT